MTNEEPTITFTLEATGLTTRQRDRFGMTDRPRTPCAKPRIVHAELVEGFDIDGVAVSKDTDGARALMKPVDQRGACSVFLSVGQDPIAVAEAPPRDDLVDVGRIPPLP